jgi:prepilin-type N-terminal cleavage/methylation domain-containing protein
MGRNSRRCRGFTLVEMLVSLTVSLIILGLVAVLVFNAANLTSTIHNRLAAFHDSNLALDYLAQDLASILPPSQSISGAGTSQTQTTLTITPDTVNGVSTWWITFLSRPRGVTPPGMVAAVSYRMAYQDPNQSVVGSTKEFALYRSVVTTINASKSFFNQTDLNTGYWSQVWPTYAPSNIIPVDDYLLGNVVGISIKANYRYFQSATDVTGTIASVPLTSSLNCTNAGFIGTDITNATPSANGPNIPLSIDIIFTVLRSHGAGLYQDGSWTLSQANVRDGITITRNFSLKFNSVD